MKHLKKYNESKEIVWVGALDDDDFYIPIYTERGFLYTGKDALPTFDTEQECQEWCDKTNAEMKKDEEELYEESLEEKMLKRKLKMYDETLSMSQMECVIDAMKEVTLQRKLGNWTNKPK